MTRKLVRTVFAALLLTTVGGCIYETSLFGTITYEGEAVEDAKVFLVQKVQKEDDSGSVITNDYIVVDEDITDRHGMYSFRGYDHGDYLVMAGTEDGSARMGVGEMSLNEFRARINVDLWDVEDEGVSFFGDNIPFLVRYSWLTKTKPYIELIPDGITVNGESRPWVEFDADRARDYLISENAIEFTWKIVRRTRKIHSADSLFDSELPLLDPEIKSFFEGFTLNSSSEATQYEEDGVGHASYALHCGGGWTQPQACGHKVHVYPAWSSKDEVARELLSLGFHATRRYAMRREADYSYDHTLPLYSPCGTGVFRKQAVIYQKGNRWTYKWERDLNPEVYNQPLWGDWPHYYWDIYVAWWHLARC